jgi:hypothetical protein
MRRLVLIVAAAAMLSLACGTVRADNPYGDGYGPNYAPNYGYQVNNYYGGGYRPYYAETYEEAAQRIRAAHSRYRYFTHPLSLQNAPPTQADYYGWDY